MSNFSVSLFFQNRLTSTILTIFKISLNKYLFFNIEYRVEQNLMLDSRKYFSPYLSSLYIDMVESSLSYLEFKIKVKKETKLSHIIKYIIYSFKKDTKISQQRVLKLTGQY